MQWRTWEIEDDNDKKKKKKKRGVRIGINNQLGAFCLIQSSSVQRAVSCMCLRGCECECFVSIGRDGKFCDSLDMHRILQISCGSSTVGGGAADAWSLR